ncbi:MAG TPA: PIN domain-containing protein [Candidatus Dormibacteraeota bacterium]
MPAIAVLDTSVIVRYLTRDDPAKADASRAYIAGQADGALLFPDVAMAELGFVLLRVYRWGIENVARALRAVVSHPAIDVPEGGIWLDVADDLEQGLGLVDAYLMRVAQQAAAGTLVTFDSSMRAVPGVVCREP